MWFLLTTFFAGIVGPILWRVIGLLGFGLIVYTGIDIALVQIEQEIQSYLGALGAPVYQMLDLLGVITGLNLIVSAFSARLLLMGITGGTRTVFGLKA